ncbi:hypothetical protein J0S82_020786 [Galemys pyrenaicus]|uniref:Uncharacterized protein n=1 Tax=Galemys pyrenaicus TaxID=202257 RepID=A0A8J6A6L2_GALPY|nr:hypothetical protein J0S82_020786 [Galemys pyrenaicus]
MRPLPPTPAGLRAAERGCRPARVGAGGCGPATASGRGVRAVTAGGLTLTVLVFQIYRHSYTGYYVLSKIPHGDPLCMRRPLRCCWRVCPAAAPSGVLPPPASCLDAQRRARRPASASVRSRGLGPAPGHVCACRAVPSGVRPQHQAQVLLELPASRAGAAPGKSSAVSARPRALELSPAFEDVSPVLDGHSHALTTSPSPGELSLPDASAPFVVAFVGDFCHVRIENIHVAGFDARVSAELRAAWEAAPVVVCSERSGSQELHAQGLLGHAGPMSAARRPPELLAPPPLRLRPSLRPPPIGRAAFRLPRLQGLALDGELWKALQIPALGRAVPNPSARQLVPAVPQAQPLPSPKTAQPRALREGRTLSRALVWEGQEDLVLEAVPRERLRTAYSLRARPWLSWHVTCPGRSGRASRGVHSGGPVSASVGDVPPSVLTEAWDPQSLDPPEVSNAKLQYAGWGPKGQQLVSTGPMRRGPPA